MHDEKIRAFLSRDIGGSQAAAKKNRLQAMELDGLGINIPLGVFFRTANHDKLETCVFTGRRLSYGGLL